LAKLVAVRKAVCLPNPEQTGAVNNTSILALQTVSQHVLEIISLYPLLPEGIKILLRNRSISEKVLDNSVRYDWDALTVKG
jgi:hypothetical protein